MLQDANFSTYFEEILLPFPSGRLLSAPAARLACDREQQKLRPAFLESVEVQLYNMAEKCLGL